MLNLFLPQVPSGSAPLSVGVTVDYFVALDLNGLAPDRAPTLGALNVALINSAVNAESLLFFSLSTIVPSVCSISFVSADVSTLSYPSRPAACLMTFKL